MNTQLNFPIGEKSIYQMGFNSGPPPPVTNYVTEPTSLTNHLHILEMLNPQNPGTDDRKREFWADLMAPHYEKQAELEKKIDDLSETLNNFIRAQQSVNELIIEKYLRQNSPRDDENRLEEQHHEEENEMGNQHHSITNPMPVYAVPIVHESRNSSSPPLRNRSVSPEKMETGEGMTVRDFLKNTMTVQKADDKLLEEERARERDEASQVAKFNKFRVRNRPKKYKRSAVTFTSSLEPSSSASSHLDIIQNQNIPPPVTSSSSSSTGSQLMELHSQNNVSTEIEENIFPIVVPCVQRAPELELALMQPVFPSTSSYVLNPPHTSHHSHNTLTALTAVSEAKFQTDPNNIWKAVDGVTQLLVDAPALLESDLRTFSDHSHHSSFLPFVGNQEHHPRSAFVPPHYHKERRIHMDHSSITDTLRNL
ncbi:unnamed protein product [Caenorhabditis sp. 36 PRJEB53466]|nr:unnamed protein product [Caenorhabditis sp. 36 PRJEB53466]